MRAEESASVPTGRQLRTACVKTRVLVVTMAVLAGVLTPVAEARITNGTAAPNTIRGSQAADTIRAGAGKDRVYGRGSNDKIFGQAGNDYLAGGAGNDLVVGGRGRDVISCGAGRDTAFADAFDRVAANCERLVGAVRGPGGRIFPAGAVFSAGVASSPSRSGAALPTAAADLQELANPLVQVSTDAGVTASLQPWELVTSGSVHLDSQTEPWVDVNPADRSNIVGFWQEDRWSTGGARNLVFGTSFDGGATWTNSPLQGVSRLAGGIYERVTDPWLDFGPSDRVYATSLAFDDTFPFKNAIFVHTSTDGGATWGPPVTVAEDTEFQFFNDKQALVADDYATSPFVGNVYVTWDRLEERATGQVGGEYTGPAYFSRSTDGGATFSQPQVIFATGVNKQTLGNMPVVLPDVQGTAANETGTVVVGGPTSRAPGSAPRRTSPTSTSSAPPTAAAPGRLRSSWTTSDRCPWPISEAETPSPSSASTVRPESSTRRGRTRASHRGRRSGTTSSSPRRATAA